MASDTQTERATGVHSTALVRRWSHCSKRIIAKAVAGEMLDNRVTKPALRDETAHARKTVWSRVYPLAEDARDWKIGAKPAHLVAAARASTADGNVRMIKAEALVVWR